jgi:hypothetical protein
MSSVDVDIYMTQLVKFFNDNPTDLNAIIGDLDSDKFYEEVRRQAASNLEKGEDVQLSQSQIIDIVVKLSKRRAEKDFPSNLYFYSKFGPICLN